MDDIHAPTVASGPTSNGYSNGVSKEQLSLQELIAEKDRVETELKALGQVLDSVSQIRYENVYSDVPCLTCLAAWSQYEHWFNHLRRLSTRRHRRASE